MGEGKFEQFINTESHLPLIPKEDTNAPTLTEEAIIAKRYEREIFPDAEERLKKTLAAEGLELITLLENDLKYPNLKEWVNDRIAAGEMTRYYPFYARDAEKNRIVFCKAELVERQKFGGFEREVAALSGMPENMPVPGLIRFRPRQEGQLGILITEAVELSKGSCLRVNDWTPQAGSRAMAELKKFETIPLSNFPELPDVPEITIEKLLENVGNNVSPELRQQVEETMTAYQSQNQPVFVHSDTWVKNILVGTNKDNPDIYFVDWEGASTGYRGQDAGRFFRALWGNVRAHTAAVESFLSDQPGKEPAAERLHQLRFGVIFEALKWLEDRSSNDRPDRQAEIQAIDKTAFAMLNFVDEVYKRLRASNIE